MQRDITHLVERLEAFEERSGTVLQSLFASIGEDDNSVRTNGELPRNEVAIVVHR